MPDNEAGAFLNITPDVLKKLDSFDEKLEKIEKHAHTAADALKNGFGSVVVDTSKLENAIASLASKISALNTAGRVFDNIGDSVQQSSVRVEGMSSSISSMAQTLNQLKFSNFSIETFSPENVAKMRETVSQIKSQLKNNTSLSDSDKSALSKEKAMYEEKLKEYQSFINIKNKIAANANAEELRQQQATYRKMTNVMESYMKKVEEQKQRYESAMKSMADYAAQSPAQRVSLINNTLNFSANAKTLQEDVAAIKLLKETRLQLDKTDKNYQATLNQINSAIAKHNQALTEAGVKSQQLATRHRNLMDTAGQLSRQLALVFSVSQIEGYISKLANVRGEFELQQRSLEAILQNKAQADQIFNKTVQLAVKSPFQIKELVTFTKQLAAYRIESDKLYDTTKRLADVSAGLGVDMGRLILAYGQVKAAAYLRGTEVRQFTEAGINLYGELQRYFQEVKGEAYTTAQIVDMISKRKVTFEDIENIFTRITDKGGIFYNMQEIQAETLRGKISNLKDSIDVMLNSIGKANEDTLKGSIDSIKVLIDNWETVVNIAKAFAPIIASMAITVWAKKIGVANGAIGLFSVGLGKAGNAIKAFGATFKASFPLMAITAALGIFNELIKIQDEYNKRQKEAENKYYKGKVRTSEIERLSVTIDEKTSKPKVKEALNALVKEMNNEGFAIEIKANISENEAREQYDKLLQQHKQYLDDMLVLDYKYNTDKKSNSMFWETDADEANTRLTESYQRALATITQIRTELAKVADKGTGFIAQEELKELELGVTESGSLEAIQDYYKKLLDFLESIQKTYISTSSSSFGIVSSTTTTTFAGIRSNILENVNAIKNSLDSSKNEMTKKIRSFFDNVFNFKNYDNDVKAAMVNNYAISHDWSQDFVQQITAPIYDIDFTNKGKTDNNTGKDTDTKLQRDILAERISLIKELNKEYEKLNKVMGSDKAAKTVMERYASQLKDVQMPKNIIGEAFLPNKENTAKALQELAKIITDFRKKIGAQKDANVLFDEKDADDFKKQLDKTKDNIESMFNGLDLHKKLKDAGLSEAEVQQLFPGLAKTLDDVQKGIEAEYQKKFPKGEYLIADTDANKQYLADLNKLNQQRIKDSQDLVIELTKNYKSQLTDRLQLDRWYYEERAKIQRAKLTDKQKTLYESNLTSQYNKKSDENTWKQFQNSDMYISMFENIEGASTRMLTAMRDKLMSLRENLKDLPADQLKAIINQQEKIDEMIAKKNPFIGLTSGVKEYIQFLKERKELEEENIRANNAVDYYTSQSNEQSKIVEQKRQEYNAAVATYGILSKEAKQLLIQFETEKSKLDIILKQLTAEKKISKETAEQIRNGQNLGDTLKNKIGESGRIFSEFSSALPQIASDLENVFGSMSDGTKDVINRTAEAAGGIAQIATGIAQGPVGYLQAAMGLAKTVSALFGSDDARLQKEIEGHERKIKKLEREYDKLKESIDNVWDITKLQEYGNELDENINKQIVSLNAMIAAERDKKDTDWDKINEWQEQIEDLRDTLADSANDMIAELGGVGSDENFKTLAENFASAWLEAFQETGDGLSGLQESFDDFMENYVKQQILLRLSDKFLKPMFDEFDSLIATRTDMEQEDQERYFELQAQITRLRNTANNSVIKSVAKKANAAADEIENSEEYKRLQKAYTDFLKPNDINTEAIKDWSDKMKEVFGEYNEAAEEIFNQIGWEPGGKANLSALTQSIQGITETTAEALEALLNSIRFFVNQQTIDITAIRNLLDARYSLESQAETNPMLIELKAQTGYLEIISDRIDRVFAPNSNSRGAGLRVFISD
jgi:DNA repair exonuclease SbcCD ATPase subunit|uniref:tape measure protein n=1 Tax=Phocaeicola vulgatus TaxID=821 RepID=UPI003FF05F1A